MSDDPGHPAPPISKVLPVCAIGASAGGVSALQALFRALPADLGLAYVVILHLSPDHPSALSEILSSCTKMPVFQVDDGPTLKANCVYVIPPDRELVIKDDHVVTRAFNEPRGRRAPIDMFFRSIAAGRGDGIAVVLSGAGADGAIGVRAVKEAGGVVMVQEPAEATFASMPQNAIASGVADFVAPLARLAERIVEVAHSKEAVRSLDMEGHANDLRRIIAFLRARTGHDFASYKRATVMRRVVRRMQVCRTDTLAAYADYLVATPEETKELLSDLLISVTMFFRDPHAFEVLAQKAIRPLFDDFDPDSHDGMRMWVVGCATGEEAYSLAILVHEEAARRKLLPVVQIFASDLDEGALATAREGRYPRSIEADVSQERLARFFTDEGTHYRVRKEVRESVLFSMHSVIKDPPFIRLDLIACRNLLIYLERAMQQQLHSIFHYCLKPGRYLFLGSAETSDSAAELFAPVDRDARLYCARPQAIQLLPVIPFATPERLVTPVAVPARIEDNNRSATLHVSALEQSAPPTALVDDMQNILHLSPTAGRFILHSAGPLSNTLPAVVRPELRLDLRLALARALDQKQPTLTHPTIVAFDGEQRRVAVQVAPVPGEAHMGAQALVFFLDGGPLTDGVQAEIGPDDGPDEVRRLHAELKLTQEALVASRNGREVAVQDLRASNEELQSINEEYRSTAEELETSKEELQSINEELHTVNAELKTKLASISVAHSDLQNLTAATDVGALFLDTDLRIKMFTPPVAELFNITRADIGRAVAHFRHNLEYEALEGDAQQVLRNLAPLEREIRSRDGRWYVVRLRPYRTIEDRIDGTVVTFVDITERRRTETALRESEEKFHALFAASPQPFLVMKPDAPRFTITDVNDAYLAATMRTRDDVVGRAIFEAYPENPDDVSSVGVNTLRASLTRVLASRQPETLPSLKYDLARPDGSFEERWWSPANSPMLDRNGEVEAIIHNAIDVTVEHRAAQILRQNELWLAAQKEAFQAAVNGGPLEISLGILMRAASEYLNSGCRCAFYILEPDGRTMRHVVGMSEDYAQDVNGRETSPESMAHDLSIGDGQPVVTPDVRADPRWQPWLPLAEKHDFRAYWSFPVETVAGTLVGSLVCYFKKPREAAPRDRDLGAALTQTAAIIIASHRANAAMRESEERLRQFGEASTDVLWIRAAETLQWEYLSPAFETIYGLERAAALRGDNMTGWLNLIVPEDRQRAGESIQGVHAGKRVEFEYRVRRPRDGEVRWLRNTDFPMRDPAGAVRWIAGVGRDITAEKETAERMQVLVSELQHRTRNLMGVVRTMADKTMRRSVDLADFQTRFSGQLTALTRVQSLFSRLAEGERITFDELIRVEMAAMDGEAGRVTLDGPKGVALRSSTVQTFSLALHELATNAAKYGAFAQAGAQLEIRWRVEQAEADGRPWLHVDWRERGVEMPAEDALPQGSGSGRELIERALPYQLGAVTTFKMESDGVHCTIALPVSKRQTMTETGDA